MSKAKTEALEWVVRRSSGTFGLDDQAAFDAWLRADPSHRGAYLRARAIEHALASVTPDEALRPSLDKVRDGLDARGFRSLHHGRRTFVATGLAAGVAALGAAYLLYPTGQTVLKTAKGELRRLPLADHSTVSINGASQVAVALGAHQRKVSLEQGEAWFEVAKDKSRPFIVQAGGVSVRAVGTAFAVRLRDGGADVAVTEGVVEVWNQRGAARKRRLAAGEHAFVPDLASDIVVAREPQEVARRLAWRDGLVVFREQTLAEAAAEFNRYNARTIVIRDARLGGETLVGQYRLDDPARFADDMHVLLGVPVAMGPDRIEIGR